MRELLHIKNFGPIKEINLVLRKVNVLIGDQGTGKSTVAKVLSMIRNFAELEVFNLQNVKIQSDLKSQFLAYLQLFEMASYLRKDSEIKYIDEHRMLEVSYANQQLGKTSVRRGTGVVSAFNYITAERVFVSTLADAFFGLNEFGTKLPTLFNRFGNKYASARKVETKRNYGNVIGADFEHANGVDMVVMSDGQRILLNDGSTGLQGTIPMLVVFDSIVNGIDKFSQKEEFTHNLLVVEEPELNLFPFTQKKVVDYIIERNFDTPKNVTVSSMEIDNVSKTSDFKSRVFKNQLFVTTHSPYVLTSLNNLIYAYQIGAEHGEEVNKIVPKERWLNPKDVSCYFLEGGVEKSIIDDDGLIEASYIDAVSNDLNNDYIRINEIKASYGLEQH